MVNFLSSSKKIKVHIVSINELKTILYTGVKNFFSIFYIIICLGNDLVHGAMQIEDGWKLLVNPQRHPGAQDVYELYNVHTDPKESIDLLNDYPELVQTMQAQMQELLKEMVPQDSPDSVDHDLIVDDQGNLASGWC